MSRSSLSATEAGEAKVCQARSLYRGILTNGLHGKVLIRSDFTYYDEND